MGLGQAGNKADDTVDGGKQHRGDCRRLAVWHLHHQAACPEAVDKFAQMVLTNHLQHRFTTINQKSITLGLEGHVALRIGD